MSVVGTVYTYLKCEQLRWRNLIRQNIKQDAIIGQGAQQQAIKKQVKEREAHLFLR